MSNKEVCEKRKSERERAREKVSTYRVQQIDQMKHDFGTECENHPSVCECVYVCVCVGGMCVGGGVSMRGWMCASAWGECVVRLCGMYV